MSEHILTHAVAAFAALSLASLLTTSVAIAATGARADIRTSLGVIVAPQLATTTAQFRAAQITKAKATIAMAPLRRQ